MPLSCCGLKRHDGAGLKNELKRNKTKRMKAVSNAIGILELSSIAAGFQAEDAMLKAAAVDLLVARTICSGKYLVLIGGSVDSVQAAVDAGVESGRGYIIEKLVIPNIDPQVFSALGNSVVLPKDHGRAVGIVETFAVTPIIEAADAAVKAADVLLYRIHLAMAVGGKGYFLVSGDVSAVNAAVEAAENTIKLSGMMVNRVVIPSARKEIFQEYL